MKLVTHRRATLGITSLGLWANTGVVEKESKKNYWAQDTFQSQSELMYCFIRQV